MFLHKKPINERVEALCEKEEAIGWIFICLEDSQTSFATCGSNMFAHMLKRLAESHPLFKDALLQVSKDKNLFPEPGPATGNMPMPNQPTGDKDSK